MHAQKKHTLVHLQDLIPTLADIMINTTNQPKYRLNLVDLLDSVFHLRMHRCTYYTDGIVLI